MTNFEKFGEDFQSKIIFHLVTDSTFSNRVLEILEPDFFTQDNYVELVRMIINHYEKYNITPVFDNLRMMINTKYEDEVERDYLLDLLTVIQKNGSLADKEFIIDNTVAFCKEQAIKNAILKSVDLLQNEQYDEIYNVIKNAMTAGESNNVGHNFFGDVYARTMDKRNPIPTGLKMLDDVCAGGLSAGEIGIIMAGTGIGKSMVLAYIAVSAYMLGYNVVYYSLELRELMVGLRMDSKFSNIPLSTLLKDFDGEYREKVKETIQKVHDKFKGDKPSHDIIIKEFPTKGASVNTLKRHLTSLQNDNFSPELIIVDYADLLKPSNRYSDKRHELESIVEELRGMGLEFDAALWTASQTNKDGLEASIVGLKAMSEALSKAFAADLVVSVGRTPELVAEGRACWYIPKSRLGPDKLVFTGKFDTSTLDLTIDTEGLDEVEVRNTDSQNNVNRAVRKVIKNNRSGESSNENLRGIIDGMEK